MIQRRLTALPLSLVLALALLLQACGDGDQSSQDPAPPQDAQDVTDDVAEEEDMDEPDTVEDTPDTTEDEEPPPEPKRLCEPCQADDECGGPNDLCFQLPNDPVATCGLDCLDSDDVCPEDFRCATVQEEPLVRQCIPNDLLCADMCQSVTCDGDTVCNPIDGACNPPLGLCDLGCLSDELCGGPEDRCVFLNDTNENFCARSCDPEAEEETCPDTYFCAEVGTDTGNFQCIPQSLTCVDRCRGEQCGEGEVCDPLSGDCTEALQLCDDNCTNNDLCGGPNDGCISLNDGETVCVTACEDAGDCPINFFCADLDNRELGVCVPFEVTCTDDRCEGVECGPNANCNPRTGECVARELELCDPCGNLDSNACGGEGDLCLNLGEQEGVRCTMDCSETGECPNEGYTCVILNNSTRRACIPVGNSCERCANVECPEGSSCNPLTGACDAPPTTCPDTPCNEGEICNEDSGECEIINEACTFETRVTDCFGPVRKCTATRPNSEGVCALVCNNDEDCNPGSSCTDLSRVGTLCTPDGLGDPTTCGVLSPEGASVGKRCGSGVSAACPTDAPTCIQNVEPGTQGFCSLGCENDLDCGGEGTCQSVRGRAGNWCVPSNCLCLTGEEVPDGSNDILAQALGTSSLSRCSFSINPAAQIHLDSRIAGAPFKSPQVNGLLAQPLSGATVATSLQQELRQQLGGDTPARDAFLSMASRQGITLERDTARAAIPDDVTPLVAGFRAFAQAAGDTFSPENIEGETQSVPEALREPIAQVLFASAEVLQERQALVEAWGLSLEAVEALFQSLPCLYLTCAAEQNAPNLQDPDVLSMLQGADLTALFQATANLASLVEQIDWSAASQGTATSLRMNTSAGAIVLQGTEDNIYTEDNIAILIDLGGNDTYNTPAGATSSPTQPLGLLVDLGGNDTYQYEAAPDPQDQEAWLPSDAGGRFSPTLPVQSGNGPVSLSNTPRQGAGRLGAGLLFDFGNGQDQYTSLRMSQGTGLMGAGLLFDQGGNDTYRAEALSQGAGVLGTGVLVDAGASEDQNTYEIWHAGQGFGGAGGAGLLLSHAGDDTYTAAPATGLTDVLYFSPGDRGQSNQSLAQGTGSGVLPPDDRNPNRQALGGGFGALVDTAGDDTYTAGTHAQGAGQRFGIGVLADLSGNDTYTARLQAQGTGDTAGYGILLEGLGNDQYNQEGRQLSALMGHGNNLGAGFLLDRHGNDAYRAPNLSNGAGVFNGAGIFLDLSGLDTYTAVSTGTWGFALLGPEGNQDGNPRRDVPTYGLFLDAKNNGDTYARPDLEEDPPPAIGNEESWSQSAANVPSEIGIGIDGEGLTGFEQTPE